MEQQELERWKLEQQKNLDVWKENYHREMEQWRMENCWKIEQAKACNAAGQTALKSAIMINGNLKFL